MPLDKDQKTKIPMNKFLRQVCLDVDIHKRIQACSDLVLGLIGKPGLTMAVCQNLKMCKAVTKFSTVRYLLKLIQKCLFN